MGLRGTGQKAMYRGAEPRCPAARPQQAPQRGLTRRLRPLPGSHLSPGARGEPLAPWASLLSLCASVFVWSGRYSRFWPRVPSSAQSVRVPIAPRGPAAPAGPRASGWVGVASPPPPPSTAEGHSPALRAHGKAVRAHVGHGESGTGEGGHWGVGDGQEGSHSPKRTRRFGDVGKEAPAVPGPLQAPRPPGTLRPGLASGTRAWSRAGSAEKAAGQLRGVPQAQPHPCSTPVCAPAPAPAPRASAWETPCPTIPPSSAPSPGMFWEQS